MIKKSQTKKMNHPVIPAKPAALSDEELEQVTGGTRPQKPDAGLDAGIHFKYDIKANKEA